MKKTMTTVVWLLFLGLMLTGTEPSWAGKNDKGKDVSITISPERQTVAPGAQVKLSVSVSKGNVVWPAASDIFGSYTSKGKSATWTLPTIAGDYNFTVRAAADSSKTATAIITVKPAIVPVTIEVVPDTATLEIGATLQFEANVTGTTKVPAWALTGDCGNIDNTGLFTATSVGSCEVTASVPGNSGGTITDSASITVFQPVVVPIRQVIKNHVSSIDADMQSYLQAILADGVTQGRIPGRLGQWGDSLTYTHAYMGNLPYNYTTEDGYSYLPIAQWMGGEALGAYKGQDFGNNSSWMCSDWMTAGDNIMGAVKPSWALIMFGSNDANIIDEDAAVSEFTSCMTQLVQKNIAAGIIPVLSTLPPQSSNPDWNDGRGNRPDMIQRFNAAIIEIAETENIPYVDLYGLLLALHPTDWANTILEQDGVHLSFTGGDQAIGLDATLKDNGYWLRTLLTAEMAEKLKAIVFDQAPPSTNLRQIIKDHVPVIDTAMQSRLQAILADGVTQGRIPGRLGQWGDSMTYTNAYMGNLPYNYTTEDGYSYLPIAQWMGGGELGAYKGQDYGNNSGWMCSDWMAAGDNIMGAVNPSWALIMFGSNDANNIDEDAAVSEFTSCMTQLVQKNINAGIIPVLSTLPPQSDNQGWNDGRGNRPEMISLFNAEIIEIAKANNIPYVDLYGLLLELHPTDWAATILAQDGVHLSFTGGDQAIGLDATLKDNGYWLRTLLTAEMAEKLKAIVFAQAPSAQ